MALDLILGNARIVGSAPDAPLQDIGIQDGKITAIEPALSAEGEEIELKDRLGTLPLFRKVR